MTLRKKNVGYGRVLAVSLLLGSNDGCHIPIKCPPGGLEASKEYHDFKNFNSILLMGLVDSHYRFVWGSCNFPGNSHDAVIVSFNRPLELNTRTFYANNW